MSRHGAGIWAGGPGRTTGRKHTMYSWVPSKYPITALPIGMRETLVI